MPKYKVLKPGFFGGIFREPGGRHDPVVTAKPIPKKEQPSWLELMKASAKKKDDVTTPNDTPDSFMGDKADDDDAGVETL